MIMKKKWGIIAFGMAFILLLGILAAGMKELYLCPGLPIAIDRPPPRGVGAGVMTIDMNWAIWLLYSVIIGWVIIAILGFIFIPQARRKILIGLAVVVVLTVGYSLFFERYRAEELVEEEIPVCPEAMAIRPAQLDLPPSEAVGQEAPPPPAAPGWAIYVAAGALGIVLALLLLRRRRGKLRSATLEEEIARVVCETSAELRQGLPIANTVMRCWMRMVEILSLNAGVRDSPELTPRELAGRLHDRGFAEGAIDRLTHLFEEVRYGHLLLEPRREEALAALSDIENGLSKNYCSRK